MNQKFKRFVPENKKEKIIMASIILIIFLLLVISLTAAININSLDDYDMSSVTLSDSTISYDGEEHSLQIEGDLPDGVTESYTYNGEEVTGVTNAGTYTVVASFTGDTSSYNTISDIEATLTISTATLDTTDITLSDASYAYDGEEHSLEVNGDLPEGVTASYTYEGKEVTGVTEIGEYSVEATLTSDNYSTVTLTATLTITENDDYSYTINDDETSVTLTAYLGSKTDITTPTTITADDNTYSVTSIGDYCFSPFVDDSPYAEIDTAYCENGADIESIAISSGVTSIGVECFLGCTNLTSVTLPDDIVTLGQACFTNSSITSITIPNSVTTLPSNCFEGCTSLVDITIPDSVTNFASNCFYGCTGLVNIIIPDSVTYYGMLCFYGCTNLTSITMSNGLKSIGYCCFYGCTNLASIIIPDNVTSIGDASFANCTSLANITIPESVQKIGDNCFYGCTNLTSITFENQTSEWKLYNLLSATTYYLYASDDSQQNAEYLTETYVKYTWSIVTE